LEETLRRAETVLSQEDYARLKLLAESYVLSPELFETEKALPS
jgi:hypothetical protein